MSWPVGTNLQARLAAAQVLMPDGSAVPASIASNALMLAAVRRFEELTGWVPFEGATQTRLFDAPGRAPGAYGSSGGGGMILNLNGGLISVTTFAVSGVTKTEGTDFWLLRARPDMPAWGIRLNVPIFGPAQCVSIAGSWGRMAAADELAYEAVLNLGAQMAVQSILDGFFAMPLENREADVSEKFSADGLKALGSGFAAIAEPVIALYRRVTVGF